MTSTEGASNSDSDSTDSRDVNLNSKNFTDCNLFGNIKNTIKFNEFQNPGYRRRFKNEGDAGKGTIFGYEKTVLSGVENNPELYKEESPVEDHASSDASNGDIKFDPPVQSTPYRTKEPTINGNDPPEEKEAEKESDGNTYHVDLNLSLNGISSLSDEEVEKKFIELGLAFRTDSLTLSKRLKVRKRQRDQAETNVESEVESMKEQLDNLQYLCKDCDSLQLVTDMRKHLDAVLASAINLSSSAEAYGYVQNEEKVSGAVFVMLQHLENVERIKSEKPDRLKSDGKRSPFGSVLDDDKDDERIIRRRSIATVSLNGSSRRRASIASLPRALTTSQDSSGNLISNPLLNSSRTPNPASRILSSQPTNRILLNSSTPGSDQTYVRRESGGVLRYRKENRGIESGMDYIEEFPERVTNQIQENEISESNDEDENPLTEEKKHLILQKLTRSTDDSRSNSDSLETLNILDCLRRLFEWNVIILSSARFRWPDSFRHYVPFVLTWYVIIVLATIFAGGLLIGINGCCTYSFHWLLWLQDVHSKE